MTVARNAVSEHEEDAADEERSSHSGGSASSSDEEGGEKEELGEGLDQGEAEALREDLGEDDRHGKRLRKNATKEANSDEGESAIAGPSTESESVWQAMQVGKDAVVEGRGKGEAVDKKEELVQVVRTYRFAGEEVREEKLVPASSSEAKAYLAAQQKAQSQPSASVAPPMSSTTRPPPPPGPRKRKAGSLAAMSAAATAKPAKLNTLEKSKMDWSKYKDTSLGEQEKHELDAQTRGGGSGLGSMKGYMERKNFLERVQGRLDEQEKEK